MGRPGSRLPPPMPLVPAGSPWHPRGMAQSLRPLALVSPAVQAQGKVVDRSEIPWGFRDDGKAIDQTHYGHEDIIDLILANPQITQVKLCEITGYSGGWMSRVIASDAFQERFMARRTKLVDPLILASLEERLRAISIRSTEVIMQKLDGPNPSAALAVEALKVSSRALSYGARPSHRQQKHAVPLPSQQPEVVAVQEAVAGPAPQAAPMNPYE